MVSFGKFEPHQSDETELLMQLTFMSNPDRLPVVRASVHAAALACGFEEDDARDVVLAIDEACANVIVHGYGRRDDADIVLTIYRLERGIRLQLRDFAPPVSPRAMIPRDPRVVSPGGLGTHFIRTIMDDAKFMRSPENDGNILELTKRTLVTS